MRNSEPDRVISFFYISLFVTISVIFWSCENKQGPIDNYLPDSLSGDWKGTQTLKDGDESQLVAQVISYGDEGYVVNLLDKFDTPDSKIAVLSGEYHNGKIEVEGNNKSGIEWEGFIQGNIFEGSFSGKKNGTFKLVKVERLSPTLGKPVPDGGLILFDGLSFDNWQHVPPTTGYVDLYKIFKMVDAVVYLQSEIFSEKSQEALLLLGSDDGVVVWLNGQLVHAKNIGRGASPDQDTVRINLKEGWNNFLLKVINGSGGWGLFARITDFEFRLLKNISESDYNSEVKTATTDYLKQNNFFLTEWKLAGPYKKNGSDAKELFGIAFEPEKQTFKQWKIHKRKIENFDASWSIVDGAMQVSPGSGLIMTRQKFIDFSLHIEFRSPFMPNMKGQKRGNSGVYVQGRYEVQVLDSYGLQSKDNDCGGIYKVAVPNINMCAPPAQWQTYDIEFTAAKYNDQNEKMANARITVRHNGIIIHNDLEIPEATDGGLDKDMSKPGPILLQDHSDLVQFRNIWIVEK